MIQKHLTHPQYRPDIDGLRAVAVLSVVGFHAFPDLIEGGFAGVDIFFVISGYLISTIIFGNLEQENFSYAEFYSRRIKRIFPALILVLVTCFVFGWHVLLAAEYKQLGKHMASGAGFLSNFVLWFESGYFDNDAQTKPLLHLWSLGIEEQFYIVWPLLLGLVWKQKWNFLTLTLLIAVASFAANIITVADNPVGAFYSPLSRFWELMIGGILAYLVLHSPKRLPRTGWESPIGLILVATGILVLNDHSRFPGWWALLPTAGAFLIIAAGPGAWLNRHLLGSRVLVWIGLISYPLYLWHWPILVYARIVDGQSPSNGIRVAAVFASIALAWLTFEFIEKPVRQRRVVPNRDLSVRLGVAMIVVCLAGLYTYQRDGLKFRTYNRLAGIGKDYDWGLGYRLNQCFLNATDTGARFADFCVGVTDNAIRKPLVLLWGDSHAASLYRGLYKQAGNSNFDLAQYTVGGCPPIVGFSVDNIKGCQRLNDYVISKITELRPDTVVLGAYWAMYNGDEIWNRLDLGKLELTVKLLRDAGVRQIVLVGQLPAFEIGQPNIAAKDFVANKVDRSFRGFVQASASANEKMRVFSRENSIGFVSPMDLLCNTEGCLLSTSKAKLIPLAYDEAHLTEDGSTLLFDLARSKGMLQLPQ